MRDKNNSGYTVKVLVPCYNEAATIGSVIKDFQSALPDAEIVVYDNNSTDGTIEVAQAAGAVVYSEKLQGKGHVVRRMFADQEADIFILVDGDGTYHAASADRLVRTLIDEHCDMVNARRVSTSKASYRFGHRFGNRLLTGLVTAIFGARIDDMLSGYRAFSRRFVKSFPALSEGFEIETELTVHALDLHMPITEVDTPYQERPEGSTSKLNTLRDGIRILRTIVTLTKQEKPILFFGAISGLLAALSIGLAIPLFLEFAATGLVPRFPTAILSASIMLLAFLFLFSGIILDTVTRGRAENKRLHYLATPWLTEHRKTASGTS